MFTNEELFWMNTLSCLGQLKLHDSYTTNFLHHYRARQGLNISAVLAVDADPGITKAPISLPETETLPSAKFFAECQKSGTRQRPSLPSAVLGKELHSAKIYLPSARHSAKMGTRQRTSLPSARLSAKSRHSA